MEQDINQSFKKLLDNQCSANELDELLAKVNDDQYKAIYDRLIINQLSEPVGQNEISSDLRERLDARLKQILDAPVSGIEEVSYKNPILKLWPRLAAAVAILLVVGLGVFFYTQRHLEGSAATRDLLANDIKPGGNKAYLVLSNGKRVSLTDAANGELAKEAGVEITKTADGQVIYSARGSVGASDGIKYSNALNTIETPRGGQYQIRLPDGSKVWLNAASKLIYPVSFIGRGQREVSLDGEAYFEIFKNKLQPFVVKSKNQEVTVLGTHFNINSYPDEPDTKTTLLEGAVQITPLHQKGKVLKPGEQAVVTPQFLKILPVDVEQATAWKNGNFLFKEEPIESVMRKLAYWYDIDVIYVGKKPTMLFRGVISRKRKLSEVLHLLELVGSVHFKIEGRKVYVTN
jgi:transmembrane sensor